jgi:hypothetical protein
MARNKHTKFLMKLSLELKFCVHVSHHDIYTYAKF